MNASPVVLITGGFSGIGQATAELLGRSGFQVFATSRQPRAAATGATGVQPLELDVTDPASVTAGIQRLLAQTDGRLDVLVNNAGYSLIGAVEETSVEEARQQFDTNFFGAMRLIQAVLPVMRKHRRGRIVNIGSVLGFLPAPYMGLYGATKHALEGFTETLDHEVRTFGVRAILVQPSFTRTNIVDHGRFAAAALDAYAAQRARATGVIQSNLLHGDDPGLVAEAVRRAIVDARPRLRYPVGKGAVLSLLRRLSPAVLFDAIFRRQFHLDAVG